MKYIFIISLIFFNIELFAQNEILLNFNDTGTGQNLSVSYLKTKKNEKDKYALGIKFHFEHYPYYFENAVHYKTFRAFNFLEHWGLHGAYWKRIKPKNWQSNLYLVYQSQMSYGGYKYQYFLPYGTAPDGTYLYTNGFISERPAGFWENSAAICLEAPLTSKLNFNITGGGGFFIIVDGHNNRIDISYEFTYLLSAGLSYKLPKKVKK